MNEIKTLNDFIEFYLFDFIEFVLPFVFAILSVVSNLVYINTGTLKFSIKELQIQNFYRQ